MSYLIQSAALLVLAVLFDFLKKWYKMGVFKGFFLLTVGLLLAHLAAAAKRVGRRLERNAVRYLAEVEKI